MLPLQRAVYFPEDAKESPWIDATAVKRYNLTFPFYPFRTLAPRDMHLFRQSGGQFEPSSPLFPAHTQINLTFKRRDKKDLLDFMVPEKLDPLKGSKGGTMTVSDRNESLKFGGPLLSPTVPNTVRSVTVKLNDAYLVVRAFPPPLFHRRFFFPPPPPPLLKCCFIFLMRARAGPPYPVQRHLSGTSAEQRFHRLPQHLHAGPEGVAVHLRSGLGKPGQTPGGVHLVHQVSRRRRRRTRSRTPGAGPGAGPGPDRAPPDRGPDRVPPPATGSSRLFL